MRGTISAHRGVGPSPPVGSSRDEALSNFIQAVRPAQILRTFVGGNRYPALYSLDFGRTFAPILFSSSLPMMRHLAAFVFLSVCLAAPGWAQSDSISLAGIQEAYDALDGLRASFTQAITSEFGGDTTRIAGSVLLSGNKYRVESPDQTVITNSTTTWIYTPADSQVVVNDAEQNTSTVTPETFLTASADRYTISSTAEASRLGTPHKKLRVEASSDAARFREATLWVRDSDKLVTRMRATDRNGSTLDLRLRDIVLNPPELGEDAPFSFSPPEHVEVIDLRRSE